MVKPRRAVVDLFVAFKARYGYRLEIRTDAQRAIWLREWGDVLRDLTDEQILAGRDKLSGREQADWPPSADEFAKLCRPPVVHPSHRIAADRQIGYEYRSTEEVALAGIESMFKALGKART